MSLFDELGGLLGSDNNVGLVSKFLGSDNNATTGLLGSAVPLLLGGLGKRAQSPGGASALFDMVKGNDGSALNNISGLLDGGDTNGEGDGLVGSIFGSQRGAVEKGLAEKSGMSLASVAKFLPALAPMVMGFLGKKQTDTNMDQAGLVRSLGDERKAMESGGLGNILGLLDGGNDADNDRGFISGLTKVAGLGGLGAAAMGGVAKAASATKDAGGQASSAARSSAASTTDRVRSTTRPSYQPRRSRFGWLKWLLPLLAILLVGWLLWSLFSDDDDNDGTNGVELSEIDYREGGILDTARNAGDFGSLLEEIESAGLTSVLDGDGPFTVFAPNDAAFAQLSDAVKQDRAAFKALLEYHVVAGEVTAADLADGSLTTLAGGEITIDTAGPTVNGAQIVTADVDASNGVIHVIDQVLIPVLLGS